jgi:DNA repair exonuclease SbcCD nuclease subunit
MKLAHVADLHLDERDKHHSLAEQVELLRRIGNDADEKGATLMLVAGDVFDGGGGSRASTPAERNAAISIFKAWSDYTPVVVVRGNHDRPGDIDFLGAIETEHPISIRTMPAITLRSGVEVACLPWPTKANVAHAGSDFIQINVDEIARQCLQTIFAGWQVAAREAHESGRAFIVLGHCEIGGATMDSGQPVGPRAEMPICAADLAEIGADYYALGHIHKHQVIETAESRGILDDIETISGGQVDDDYYQGRICYAGSVRQTDFGEDEVKGYCLVDVEPGRSPIIEHRAIESRRLVTVEAYWEGGLCDGNGNEIPDLDDAQDLINPGDDLRITYTVPAEVREQAREQAEAAKKWWLKIGAHSVTIAAKTESITRVRSEAVKAARTNAAKLEAYWAARGQRPARCASMLAMLDDLERISHGEVQP